MAKSYHVFSKIATAVYYGAGPLSIDFAVVYRAIDEVRIKK
jgi:hypothetical protein